MDNVNLRVSEDVVAAIAYKTILEIPGVFEINGNIIDGLTNMLGSKRTRGIKVDMENNQISLDTYLTVEYGVKIPDIAWDIQDKVKKTLEENTGMKVKAVNVHIQGINFDKKKAE
ncbi:MAG: Asp23/Gls24 family envelope stress response protein [Clostridia bacterium]|nr:Asp23/Gls24 family envelope stress response protein [Clostridia bacterium]